MKIRHFLRFPGFREKALTLSYDDGNVYDLEMKEILDRYGIKCTFNLCSGWLSEEDIPGRRKMSKSDALKLLSDGKHEVAVHGQNHLPMMSVPTECATNDILSDRIALEKIFNRVVKGMAYANGSVDETAIDIAEKCGIEYARTTIDTERYDIPDQWLKICPTTHHGNPKLMELAEKFLKPYPENKYYWSCKPELFFLWGHSYEFHDGNCWDILENFCKLVGNREDVWYATNGEVYAYVNAYDSLRFSAAGDKVQNPSFIDVYLNYHGKDILCPAGATVCFNK